MRVAVQAGRHGGVGIDLVAMCVNDLVVHGAEPLAFLDYYATGKLDVAAGREIVAGIAAGCGEAGCALIGGETAEMPGMYADGDYDLAGFAIGAVERDRVLTGDGVVPGDVLLGLPSSGAHANGFSLIRRVVADAGLDYVGPAPFAPGTSLGEALLAPTRIYVKPCLALVRAGLVKALAHITGGGLVENTPRLLPHGTVARIDGRSWTPPAMFDWLARTGGIAAAEMARTFNCGIGMVAVVAPDDLERAQQVLAEHGETAARIGIVEAGPDAPATATVEHLAL